MKLINIKYIKVHICVLVLSALIPVNTLLSQANHAAPYLPDIAISYSFGRLSDQYKRFKTIILDPSSGLRIDYRNQGARDQAWTREFTKTSSGYRFRYLDLGNNDVLGQLYAFSKYADFQVFEIENIRFSLGLELGGAYLNQTFDPVENYRNILVSRHFNFLFGGNAELGIQIPQLNAFGLKAGFSLLHISNGESRVPNMGFNNMGAELGMTYIFPNNKQSAKTQKELEEAPEFQNNKWDISLYPTIGLREIWRYGGPSYLALSFSSEALYSFSNRIMMGVGADIIFDETKMIYNNHNTEPVATPGEALDAGVHASLLYNLGRLQLLVRSGIPFYSANKDYWKVYNTFGIRFDLFENFFLCMYHRSSNLFIGENIQYGFGYYFSKGHRNY